MKLANSVAATTGQLRSFTVNISAELNLTGLPDDKIMTNNIRERGTEGTACSFAGDPQLLERWS